MGQCKMTLAHGHPFYMRGKPCRDTGIHGHTTNLAIRTCMHQYSTSTRSQCCDDVSLIGFVVNNGNWGYNPFLGDSIVFNKSCIACVITVLTLTLGVRCPFFNILIPRDNSAPPGIGIQGLMVNKHFQIFVRYKKLRKMQIHCNCIT